MSPCLKPEVVWGARFSEHIETCLREYKKYADTVAVLAALYRLFIERPDLGQFVGVEHSLQDASGKNLTPDLTATYESRSRGLVFELKWSISSSDEIVKLKKYAQPLSNWRTPTNRVKDQDVILVCNWEDVKSVVEMISQLVKSGQNGFFNSEGFAVWSWMITKSKENDQERMNLIPIYGKTRNEILQKLIQQPSGILIPEDVLTYNRFLYTFIRQKPPVQYTMVALIQNVLSSFRAKPEPYEQAVKLDLIYQRARIFFPSWHEYDVETVQLKKGWLKEALQHMVNMHLISIAPLEPDTYIIPIPALRTRDLAQVALCKKLTRFRLKTRKVRQARPVRPSERKTGGEEKLEKFT